MFFIGRLVAYQGRLRIRPMWIEAICVRLARPGQRAELLLELREFQSRQGSICPKALVCYQNLEVENEIGIHLVWDEGNRSPGKTECGLLLARHFSSYGLVYHSLWKVANCP
jgi:hypothetical protein